MSKRDRESELVEYYSAQHLADDKVDGILGALESETNDAPSTRRKPEYTTSVFAIATLVVMLFIGLTAAWYLARTGSGEATVVEKESTDPVGEVSSLLPKESPSFRFVAIRSHDDRCPHCRATGKMFASLETQLNKRSCAFEQLELQHSDDIERTMHRAEELQLKQTIIGRNETAFGVLLSQSGTQLLRLEPSDDLSFNRQRLLDVLDQ